MEEPGGQQRRRLVDRAGLLQQVAGGALAQPGGEALGEPVAAGQLGQRRDHARVEAGRPAAHPPGGQRDPGQQPVPARVGEADLLLGDDPQPVVHSLCTLGGGRGHPALHLGGVRPAAAQQQPGDPADAARAPAADRPAAGAAATATAASRPRTKRRAAAMSGCADGPVPATTGASTARSSATRIHHRNGEPITSTGAASPAVGLPAAARRDTRRRGRWAGWVRSSSQLSQSGVSAIAEGAGTSSRSARSRTSR